MFWKNNGNYYRRQSMGFGYRLDFIDNTTFISSVQFFINTLIGYLSLLYNLYNT